MPQPLYILFGAAWTVFTSLALGKLLFRGLKVRLYREEETPLAYLAGSACLSGIVFALAAAQVFYKGTVLATGAVALLAAWRFRVWTPRGERLPPLGPWLRYGGALVAAPFVVLCFATAMAPEMSPDGSSYHLGLVARYYRDHGLRPITTNMYANLSQGVEMLFLYGFAFGKHSGAALVHFSFLAALPWLILSYARRSGFPAAGAAAALIVFVTPVVGNDGSSAYNDVAVAAVLFAVFYLVQVWDRSRSNSLLGPIGLLAGFAFGSKYTAFAAVPYAVVWIAWRLRDNRKWAIRACGTVAACAAVMILPWLVKNSLWVGNPVSPFFNRVFPNPYIRISFEEEYRHHMRNYPGIESYLDVPLEVTVRGQKLCGLLGPFFLLSPLALGSLTQREGRRLLGAALAFGFVYVTNIGTRFLIPPLPYIALAMALVLVRWPRLLAVAVILHGVTSWPDVLSRYADQYAWRLDRIWWKQALRLESEEGFLDRKWPTYAAARMVENETAPGSRILTTNAIAEAYTTRDLWTTFQSGPGSLLTDILYLPLLSDRLPVRRLSFRFEPQELERLRVRQTAEASPGHFSVAEMRVYRGGRELRREAAWRLRSHPNPWDVREAFDNSPVTRWSSWEPARPGMWIEIDFGAPATVDEAAIEMSRDQHLVRVEVEGFRGGRWRRLSAKPVEEETAPPLALRREAAQVVKERGIGYLLIHEGDFCAPDFAARAADWGIELLGERYGFRLYRIL